MLPKALEKGIFLINCNRNLLKNNCQESLINYARIFVWRDLVHGLVFRDVHPRGRSNLSHWMSFFGIESASLGNGPMGHPAGCLGTFI